MSMRKLDGSQYSKRIANVAMAIVFISLVASVIGALNIILENAYLADPMRHLAGQVLARGTFRGFVSGLLLTVGIFVCILLAWPISRIVHGSWRSGFAGAVLALPFAAIYIYFGYQINVQLLPDFLSASSIVVNLLMLATVVATWYLSVKWLRHSDFAFLARLGMPKLGLILGSSIAVLLLATQGLAIAWRVDLPATRPNVLFVLIDTLRADRLGAYGYERNTSPNIDRLANDAWLFTQGVAQASWTKPSMASIMTGLYVGQTSVGAGNWFDEGAAGEVRVTRLVPGHVTLAEYLGSAGYETAAFGHNHHLIPRLGFSQGFLRYDWREAEAINLGFFANFAKSFTSKFSVNWIDERFLRWLDEHEDAPFLAYLHHIDVHWPYRSPVPFSGMYSDVEPSTDFNQSKFIPDLVERVDNGEDAGIDETTLRAMSNAYDEGIRFVDSGLGEIFDELRNRGLYDNTLIVVTADHGEEFLEHGKLGHGESLYDELIRVPLIIKFPCPGPYCQARRVDAQVELVDVLPTVLDALEIPVPEMLAGRSLLSPADDEAESAYSEHGRAVALRTREWKYIYDAATDTGELFDLKNDPSESEDVASAEPEAAKLLTSRVLDFVVNLPKMDVGDGELVEADERMLERLRALGYVQ